MTRNPSPERKRASITNADKVTKRIITGITASVLRFSIIAFMFSK